MKLFVRAKENQETKRNISRCRESSENNLLNSGILKRVNCINWEIELSVKSTMSSVKICFTFYRNDTFYYRSLKHTSFSTWFDGSRA